MDFDARVLEQPMIAQDRFHALDAVRAFALFLGIVLHATMSFFLFIPARDSSPSTTLAVTFYVIHIFRMSLFFLIAGFFAHMGFHRRGVQAFVKDRATRILLPLTAGWVVVAPPTIVAVLWGLRRTFNGVPPEDMPVGSQGFPLTHLWFFYYLSIFYVLALGVRAAFVTFVDRSGTIRAQADALLRLCLSSYIAPLGLAAPLFPVLFFDEAWLVYFGIPTPDTGLMPALPALAGFGTAFCFGWLLHRQTNLLHVWKQQWLVNLAIAVALTLACLAIVGPTPNMTEPARIVGPEWSRFAYTACYTVSIWFWVFGLIGAALCFCSDESPARRYLADASYWFYLAHLPIVFWLQVLLMDVPLHWTIKFPLILTITLAVLCASYRYLVRPTFIGQVLNGRKYP